MPKYEVEISLYVDAENEEEAFDKVAAQLELAACEGGQAMEWSNYEGCVSLAD